MIHYLYVSAFLNKFFIDQKLQMKGQIKSNHSIKAKARRKRPVYDALRYTKVIRKEDYANHCNDFTKYLQHEYPNAKIIVRNYWTRVYPYKGYHIQVCRPLCPFEVQIHTNVSVKLRDDRFHHYLYKKSVKYKNENKNRFLYWLLVLLRFALSLAVQVQALAIARSFAKAESDVLVTAVG